MKRYVVRRLLMAIPLLLAISFVCFCFINLIPSNPAEVALRVQQTPVITDEIIAAMEEQLGLNKPFFVRYFDWVLGCLHGDFGISYVNPKRTVAGELLRCLRRFRRIITGQQRKSISAHWNCWKKCASETRRKCWKNIRISFPAVCSSAS